MGESDAILRPVQGLSWRGYLSLRSTMKPIGRRGVRGAPGWTVRLRQIIYGGARVSERAPSITPTRYQRGWAGGDGSAASAHRAVVRLGSIPSCASSAHQERCGPKRPRFGSGARDDSRVHQRALAHSIRTPPGTARAGLSGRRAPRSARRGIESRSVSSRGGCRAWGGVSGQRTSSRSGPDPACHFVRSVCWTGASSHRAGMDAAADRDRCAAVLMPSTDRTRSARRCVPGRSRSL